jgi:hypothetical protein
VNYRLAEEGDYQQIFDLAQKHGIAKPSVGICFVAEDNGVIIGFINGGQVGFIESIVSESPISASVLHAYMEGALLAGTKSSILAGIINPVLGSILERFGYEKINQDFYIKKR